MDKKTYIVAVSGGVDSVVLLHKLMSKRSEAPPHLPFTNPQPPTYIIAHYDHGIRANSAKDAAFVKELAQKYGLKFEVGRGKLGNHVSEDMARQKRYEFLRKIKKKYGAEAVITAHHQDDVIETMIVNVLRGTGPRGLIGFTQKDIMRPLLSKPKTEILDYAKEHKLKWREDSTNQDETYLRNYVRRQLMQEINEHNRKKLLEIRTHVADRYVEIDQTTARITAGLFDGKKAFDRSKFVILPYLVQKEIMASVLREKSVSFDRKMIEKAVIGVKTLGQGKRIELQKNVTLVSLKNKVLLKTTPESV